MGYFLTISSEISRTIGFFLLSNRQCHRELVVRHVEALRESGYPSITDVPFGLVR